MARSNMFANIENTFQFASKEEIISMAIESASSLIEGCQQVGFNENTFQNLLLLGAKMGVAEQGFINEDEEEIIDEVFGRLVNGSLDAIYDIVANVTTEDDYNIISQIAECGNTVAMPLLYYILSFAYIDGSIDDKIAERLDNIYGMNLLAAFMDSGLEEVSAPAVQLTDFEAEIVSWFEVDDTLHTLAEIQEEFAYKSHQEIQETLDSLVEKGVLYGGANIVGNMYGLL